MKRLTIIFASGLALLLLAWTAFAQGGYDLSWWTVDGGGATFSTGGGYSLGGTAGQPDAGALMGNDYTLVGGFWSGGVPPAGPEPEMQRIYLPLMLRDYP